jgi:hypothetical protein
MLESTTAARRSLCRIAPAILGAAYATTVAVPAHAHFILQAPPSWMSQDSVGAPIKLGPCGDEGGGTSTGTITAFQAGQTITVTVNEVVPHPGHYRIALSVNSRSELPVEPTVTATSSTPCGSAPVQSPPVFPVLADGVFDHTAAFTAPQSIQITLPSNVTCTKCTLQVIEFMSNHPLNNPGGCFYHHCADISIQAAAGGSGTGGAAGTGGNKATGGNQGVGGTKGTGGIQGLGGSLSGGMPALGGNTGLNASGGAPASGGNTNSTSADAGTSPGDNSPAGSCSCTVPIGSSRSPWAALSIGALWALKRLRLRNRNGAQATSRTEESATRRA